MLKLGYLALTALLLALSTSIDAQESKRIHRVGILFAGSQSSTLYDALRQAFRNLGYVEGQNITIEARAAGGNNGRLRALAVELVHLKVEVLIAAGGNEVTRALKDATTTTPIVMTAGSDAVARGLISNLARPGGNVTGLTSLWDELTGKRLELLKETVINLSRVAVLWQSTGGRATQWKASQAAGKQLDLRLYSMEVRKAEDLENAFQQAVKARSSALAVTQTSLVSLNIKKITQLAARHGLPSIYAMSEHAEAGGLMAYGSNRAELFRRAAWYVDKILKGANPAELPVEQPAKFEFVVNLNAAQQIGLAVPPSVLARADRVIR